MSALPLVRFSRPLAEPAVHVSTYKVRWKVGGRLWKEGFRTAAQADSFRSALLTAARRGEVFRLATGRPTAWERKNAMNYAVELGLLETNPIRVLNWTAPRFPPKSTAAAS